MDISENKHQFSSRFTSFKIRAGLRGDGILQLTALALPIVQIGFHIETNYDKPHLQIIKK